jgi:Sulfotransferase family
MSDPRITYIMSMSHSGSTLLDVLVSGHSQAVSVGEAKRFNPDSKAKMACSCESDLVWDCPFWGRVDAALQGSGLSLRGLDLEGGDDDSFVRHNRAFYRAVQEITGKPVIVDSSKNLKRLRRLLCLGEFDVLPIHLIRKPHGVVYSHLRKERSWVRCALDYRKKNQRTRALLRDVDHELVHYEELAADPEAVLVRLMPRIGPEYEPQQLDWAGVERHNCGGNRMRRSESSSIRVDRNWEKGLPAWQKAAVSLLTYPASR